VNFNSGLFVQIVAVHRYVEHSAGDRLRPDFAEAIGQAAGEVDAAALNADNDDFLVSFIALGDFGGHAFDGAMDDGGGEK
jgi:hypothetical protein